MAKALTARTVEQAIRDPNYRREIPDGLLTGLYLIIQRSGTKTWAVRYRHAGRTRKLTLGKYPALSLAAARTEAQEALRAVAKGEDVAAAKQAARKQDAETLNDVSAIVERFIERHAKKKNRSWQSTQHTFERHVLPVWGHRHIQDITRRDVIDLLDGIVDKGTGVMANRVLAAISKLCNWCVERDILELSPCAGVRPPTAERSRDRILGDNEIRWVWLACESQAYPFGPVVKLLLLTGQRRDEVGGITDDELDLANTIWTIPADRAKNKREHSVPLSEPVLEVLESIPSINGPHGYIFTTTGTSKVSGFSRARNNLRSAVHQLARDEAAARGEDPETVSVPHWTLHDLRRTVASGMARLGQPIHVVEAILNHKSGTIRGVAAVYNRHSYLDEKRAALEAWGCFVMELVAGSPADNVVNLRH